ncbi:glycoside hydrolase family 78 protein [Mucilaginibacter sp. RS28]|uniref:alpha-L-rhamnosidase n=1 Tax=Mucilaginibacter straminoryzae TaxID=2932774 RepID=A0A9X1X3Z1_9SPHI|nr:glycoside hydrolase family 78 protein [Mucilaginibacter straminoryzae]MCJ8209233.1 glycoside hydrolase family 78 protein [Mucilaginibacter straminoryzae]
MQPVNLTRSQAFWLALFIALFSFNPRVRAQNLTDIPTWQARWIESSFPEDNKIRPAQYFRKNFEIGKKVKRAVLFITSHGMYQAQLNGKKVGDAYLTPGWTSYNKRLQYQAYDVTAMLGKGKNSLGVVVGNGWHRSALAWGDNINRFAKYLGLLAQMEITYTDGTRQLVISDGTWRSSTGSIQTNEIYKGEDIDARLEKTGWALPNYDDNSWSLVKVVDYNNSNLIPTTNEMVKKHETFKPVKLITTPKGEKVLDFGQNLVGWVVVKAKGKSGDHIIIRHAEVLDKAGNFYTDNLRAARATAEYTLSGNGEEVFEPHFTFFGFRYISVEGYPGEIRPEDFTAVALYSDMSPSGTFACSNPLLNQLQHNITWGQRGNFLDVPTDCPQRDERLGWTGDAQVFFNTAAYNFNVKKFFSKWLKDVAADQRADGAVAHVVPNVLGDYEYGSTGWGDVATIIPWEMYEVYGDQQVLKDQYESMKRWVGYMQTHTDSVGLYRYGGHYGDWLSYRSGNDDGSDAITDKYEIAQCFYAYSTQLLLNAANVLGKQDDVAKYVQLLKRIKDAYNQEYVTRSGRLVSNTQTAYVLALMFDMLPEGEARTKAAAYLADNINRYRNHLTTGFLGTPYLCHVLSRFGYSDLAYTLLLQETYPSWLYPVKMGATTIWERWDGIKPDGSFQTTIMNSFNHYAYGAIGDWMYKNIAGIQAAEPGYKKIIIKPVIGGKLNWAEGSYNCVYGKISSRWEIKGDQLVMDVTIPSGTTADIYVPDASGKNYQQHTVKAGTYHYTR